MKKLYLSCIMIILLLMLANHAFAMCYPNWGKTVINVDFSEDGSKVKAINYDYSYYDNGGLNEYYFYNVAFFTNEPASGNDFYTGGSLNWQSVANKMGNCVALDSTLSSTVGYITKKHVDIPGRSGEKGTLVEGSLTFDDSAQLAKLDPSQDYYAALLCTHTPSSTGSYGGGTFYTGIFVKINLSEVRKSLSFVYNGYGTDFSIPVIPGKTANQTGSKSNPDYTNGMLDGAQKSIVNNWTVLVNNPTANGVVFEGWYADESLTKHANFNAPINEDTTFYAKWTAPVPTGDNTHVALLLTLSILSMVGFVFCIFKKNTKKIQR